MLLYLTHWHLVKTHASVADTSRNNGGRGGGGGGGGVGCQVFLNFFALNFMQYVV